MIQRTSRRIRAHITKILGLRLSSTVGAEQRARQVRLTAWIGIAVSSVFAAFNMLTPGMLLLGQVELLTALLLLLPSVLLVRHANRLDVAELLVMLAALVIFSALIVLGGVEGSGLFWAYTAPFLAFFLKGQKQGWWYSLGFVAMVTIYFLAGGTGLSMAYSHTPATRLHFLLSLCFYTLLAANFNLLRSRQEEKMAQLVDEKTADAKHLLVQMQYLATHDQTTGLPNRTLLLEQLQQEIDAAQASGQRLAVGTLRLERLFELSNVLGLAGADSVVKQVATELRKIVDGHGLLARGRRDEFTLSYRLAHTGIDAEALGRFIARQQIAVQEEGMPLYIELTLGLTIYPEHGQLAADLLRKAEQALLQARKNTQRWSVYDAQQEQQFTRHHLLFGKLRDALQRQQLQMHYQPQIDLNSGRVVGAEALVRWPDPTEGMISPAVFIPVAEESGLIRPLTIWVLAESMRECERWHRAGLTLNISVNLSALNLLDPELPDALQAALTETGLNPRHVNLEITEGCFMASPQRAMVMLHSLHESGFKLSIDDFGTGYSSLSYLKSMPIDELKIDQSFVRKLLESTGDQAIVSSTIALAHNFHLQVVAEGIEDAATAEWLKANHCDIGQGYTYARPMPPTEFVAFVRKRGTHLAPDLHISD
jgi:diguanylate cyclase (GGDEF)-like protein